MATLDAGVVGRGLACGVSIPRAQSSQTVGCALLSAGTAGGVLSSRQPHHTGRVEKVR